MTFPRPAALLLGLACLGGLGWAAVAALQDDPAAGNVALSPDIEQGNEATAVAPSIKRPAPPPLSTADTPMGERVAVIGVLNKRDGVSRDLVLHPGEARRIGPLVVRLRACETTADWEPEQLTGAFVQAFLRAPQGGWNRIFSGWLYKESPSLNAVESPYWDVWPKACRMAHAETGPDTVPAAAVTSAPRSIAKKFASPEGATPPADAAPSPSASSNSAT